VETAQTVHPHLTLKRARSARLRFCQDDFHRVTQTLNIRPDATRPMYEDIEEKSHRMARPSPIRSEGAIHD
jgi:hypothetical protein